MQGERFLDLLKFAVWVNGETVEENANLVVRLLIRRPECLSPALRGSGSEAASVLASEGAAAGKTASGESAASTHLTLQAVLTLFVFALYGYINKLRWTGRQGGGLLKAYKDGIMLSAQLAVSHEGFTLKTQLFESYSTASGLAVDFDENIDPSSFPPWCARHHSLSNSIRIHSLHSITVLNRGYLKSDQNTSIKF